MDQKEVFRKPVLALTGEALVDQQELNNLGKKQAFSCIIQHDFHDSLGSSGYV